MIYSVIVDISNNQVDRIFDYQSNEQYNVGQRVLVNFANRNCEGYIVEVKQSTDYDINKIKYILSAKDDYTTINQELMDMCKYLIKENNLRYIDVLRLCLPSQMRGDRINAIVKRYAHIDDEADFQSLIKAIGSRAKSQIKVIEYLRDNGTVDVTTLNKQFGASAVRALTDKGYIITLIKQVSRTPCTVLEGEDKTVTLTTAQQSCVNAITGNIDKYLLHGVTGSGKTEVYLNVISKVIAEGKNAILLVPEISLTPNILRLFRNRFGDNVAILHSGLSAGERYDEWCRLRQGQASICIGARSAIFAPISNLGVIIVDEEHDGSYSSDSNPRYYAIDVAKWRAEYNNCSLVLGSATPSLTSYYDSQQSVLKLLSLPERINKQALPMVEVVDMAYENRIGNRNIISNQLADAISKAISDKHQVMLFLNRRGHSSFLMCSKCGYVAKCVDCDVSLTLHQRDGRLKCHYCGKQYHVLDVCPECGGEHFRYGKTGTEQLEQLLGKMFPTARVLRMDSDTIKGKDGHAKLLNIFGSGQADILIGTQMIAKGHDFGNVALVGIIDADQALHSDDYLAVERTFQLLTQVSGRAGRANVTGRVVLQTYTPNHYCVKFACEHNYLKFYNTEISIRRQSNFPPFGKIVRLLFTGQDEQKIIDVLLKQYLAIDALRANCPDKFYFVAKMRCPLKRIEGKYRMQIVLKISTDSHDVLQEIYKISNNKDKNVSVFVEINPSNLS